jgi:hypothetical protein
MAKKDFERVRNYIQYLEAGNSPLPGQPPTEYQKGFSQALAALKVQVNRELGKDDAHPCPTCGGTDCEDPPWV